MAKDPLDERNFYRRWGGKRTRVADILTAAEVGMLEALVAPLQEQYDGPALGTRHEYPVATVKKAHGSEPPDWLVEQRRLEREAWWLQREADHARAMALDQAPRELQRFHVAPESVQPTFAPRRARGRLTIHCDCGHTGHVILGGRPRPWRLRCSQCGEVQEL